MKLNRCNMSRCSMKTCKLFNDVRNPEDDSCLSCFFFWRLLCSTCMEDFVFCLLVLWRCKDQQMSSSRHSTRGHLRYINGLKNGFHVGPMWPAHTGNIQIYGWMKCTQVGNSHGASMEPVENPIRQSHMGPHFSPHLFLRWGSAFRVDRSVK